MTNDPTVPSNRVRSRSRSWLSGLLRPNRVPSAADLPPYLRRDIGVTEDFFDALMRHRR